MAAELDIKVAQIGGNCPVQAEGLVNGTPFYFRARGEQWSLAIGLNLEDEDSAPEWEHAEFYGEWPEAGWITTEQAMGFIRAGAERWARGEPGARLQDDGQRWNARLARVRRSLGLPAQPDAAASPLATTCAMMKE